MVDEQAVSKFDSLGAGEDLLIRKATEADLPRILEICQEAFGLEANSESELLAFMEEFPDGFLVGQVGEEIAGYSIALIQGGRPHYYAAAMAPKFRYRDGHGPGIGIRLRMRQESNLRKLGYSEMDAYVRCSNTVAIGLAARHGWKHVRTIRNFYDFPKGSARHIVKSMVADRQVSASGPGLWDRAKDVWGRLVEPRLNRGLHVKWFDSWDTMLDNALRELPEMENCPHDLFRLTMQSPSSARKRIALVVDGARAMAVVGLRQEGKHWVPVMQGIVPGAIAPARDGFLSRSLRALRVSVRIEERPDSAEAFAGKAMTLSADAAQDLLIRTATEADLPRILEICQESLRMEANSESELLGFLREYPDGFVVAQIGDEIAGYLISYVRDGLVHFHSAAVASEFRTRRGIGSSLHKHQQSFFQKLGYPEVDGYVRCTNLAQVRNLERLGWKHVRTIRNLYRFPNAMGRHMIGSLSDDGKVSVSDANLWDRAKDVWGRVVEPRLNRGLHVTWFDSWHDALDNALRELPEMDGCSRELFRLIMQNPSSTRKRTALVMDGAEPLAVVGLREQGRHWLPAMQGVIPAYVAPARDGYLIPALKALQVDVRIGDWPAPPPKSARARNAAAVPVFSIDCQSDYEAYWRKSHYMETIRDARKRTEAMTFGVDRPGSAALTIANWAEKWQDHPDQQTITASDLAVAAEYCEPRNQWHSFLLLDGDVPVAGMTGPVRGDHLVLTVSFRDPSYDRRGVGVRILDLIVQWAAAQGFAKVELGGWYGYKAKWAPQDGEHWDLRICPLRQHLREQVAWKARAVPEKLMALLRRLAALSGARDDGEQGVGGKQPQKVSK
jgi:ribosomal protein S18 acetylase RimI-like enzyme